jgi:hypothetical protein
MRVPGQTATDLQNLRGGGVAGLSHGLAVDLTVPLSGGGGEADLQAFSPAAGAVVHGRDFDRCAAHAIGDDIGCLRDHEFARTRHAAGAAEFRIFS